jgi:hypothetical protein
MTNDFREEAASLADLTKEEQRGHVARLQAIADSRWYPTKERNAARHRASALARLLGLAPVQDAECGKAGP